MEPAVWITLAVIGGLVLITIIWSVGIYNNLIALRNRFKNAFAQIDVQLKRRFDLIPNLVECAKAYMAHERGTLEAVIAARNTAVSASAKAASDPSDAGAVRSLMTADAALTGTIGKLFALAEAYPQLKADQNMRQLTEELTSTENKVAFSRQAYNDVVMGYNTAREVFPAVIVANFAGFLPAQLYELENAAERQAPQVKF
ncbi:MAG: LemA family protein [Planctomycetota bacterium]